MLMRKNLRLADFYGQPQKFFVVDPLVGHKRTLAPNRTSDMLSIIFGIILIAVSVAAFWHLLPRHGKEHPFVENTNVGSMVTILIMCSLTIGVALFFNGFGG
jgi:hypothetical protein